ncbi:MAG: O-acetylhomoserine sulfhydrylase / O-succinylhomoserine sulfhydrylase, partial [uncultured Blastococcus sp.]
DRPRSLELRDPADPRRHEPRPHDRRPRAADLRHDRVPVPRQPARRRPVRAGRDGQHLHADHEPHAGRARATRGLPRGRRRGARGVQRPVGDDAGAAQRGRVRRPHRGLRLALRRHVQPAAPLAAQAGCHRVLRRGPGRPGGVAGAGAGEHQGVLRRDDRQPQGRPARHRGRRRGRAPQRRAAGRGQHHRDAVPHPAVRVRRRRRRPLGHQVPGRARHRDRRPHRRRRGVRLDRGQAPRLHHPGPDVQRGRLRLAGRAGVRAQGPGAAAARPGPGDLPVQRVPRRPGHRDAVAAHRAARAEHPSGGGVPRGPRRGGQGELPGPGLLAVARGAAEVRAEGRRRGAHLRAARRSRGRPEVRRGAGAAQPRGQHRRRPQPGDPPGVDDALAADPRRAADDRRHPGPGAAGRRPGGDRGHPRRPRGRFPSRQVGL